MSNRVDGPHGVGGWLALLVAGMLVLGPLLGVGRMYVEFTSAEHQHPALAQVAEWSAFKTVEWVSLLIFCAISIYGGLGLATKRTPDAVFRAKWVLWFNYPISIVVTRMIIPSVMIPDGGKEVAMAIQALLVSLMAVAIWTAYLNRSKRVKNTYGLRDESTVVQVFATTHQVSRTNNLERNRNEEETLWAQALAELEGGKRRSGLWAKVFAEAQGNEAAAKANYLRDRVHQLMEENQSRKLEMAQQNSTAFSVQQKRNSDASGIASTIAAALVMLWVIVLAVLMGWAIFS